jgi:hypothetical protein
MEEKTFAKNIGFDWVKFFPKTEEKDRTLSNEIKFYKEYVPKFLIGFIKNIKMHWGIFLITEINSLRVEVYALQNKRLNEKHGEFKKDHPLYGGVVKAMEITPQLMKEMSTDKKDFQKQVNARTEPYSHHSKNENVEDLLKRKQEELKGKGLGEIVCVKMEDKPDERTNRKEE